jgi:hypothetical protein
MAPIPYEQGGLDGFCSVYSVINAVALAAAPFKHLARKDCLDLFAFLVCALKLNEQLPCVLISGCHYPTVSRLLKAADYWLANRHRLALDYRRPFHNKAGVTAEHALRRIENHLALPNRAAIIRVRGNYEHWTVVRSISAKSGAVRLCDSGNYRYLRRRSLLKPSSSRAPRLVPRDLFLISVARATKVPTHKER